MVNDPTYYFILPPIARPVGGNNVLIQFINTLNEAGYSAAPLYGLANQCYPYAQCNTPGFYTRDLSTLFARTFRPKRRLQYFRKFVLRDILQRGKTTNQQLHRKSTDIYVLPEFWYPELANMFAGARTVLATQDVYGFSRAFQRDTTHNSPAVINQFGAVFTTSQASAKAVNTIAGLANHNIPLSIERAGLTFSQNKKLQIAYMPRKRAEDAGLIISALKSRPALAGVSIVPFTMMSNEKVLETLKDSLIFLSFSSQEGFGLPPAEAMAAGCIVAGYTGVGGDEYFSKDIAYPVADSDIVAFIDTVEAIVTEYRADPHRLDQQRQAASKRILEAYNFASMRTRLLKTWSEIDAQFR
jgi:hypothetical protein